LNRHGLSKDQPAIITEEKMRALQQIAATALLLASPALAATVNTDIWYKFSFTGDPIGIVLPCIDPVLQLNQCQSPLDPPGVQYTTDNTWTLPAAPAGYSLIVIDVFEQRDRFLVVIDGTQQFLTSPPIDPNVNCLGDPDICLQTPGMSTGVFALSGGVPHAFQIFQADSGFLINEPGVGYFRVELSGSAGEIPEPATAGLIACGLAGAILFKKKRAASIQSAAPCRPQA
jgi:hypothetical protein